MTEDPSIVKTAELSCPACDEVVYAGEEFCEACGHRLSDEPPVVASPVAPAGACAGCGASAIDADGYCEHCGLRQPAERDHLEVELPGPGRPLAAGASDRGRRYSRNEDSIALTAYAGGVAAVVCDGVGSSPNPDEASLAAARTGAAELAAALEGGADAETATHEAVLKAAAAVAALAPSPDSAPSCTYVSAVTGPGTVTVGWVGDSRAYWLAAPAAGSAGQDTADLDTADLDTAEQNTADLDTAGRGTGPVTLAASRQLTADDSWAAIMVARGALSEAEAEAHPNAHVITAWLGADAEQVRPHVRTFAIDGPGTVLVCSDGLWNYFPQAGQIEAIAGDPGADPAGTARTLVARALEAGGRDNITVAVVPVTGRGNGA
ncbi:PP2C family serine/threonine-protein phosphatase [Actinomadura parmotrematis]|uniref:Protein phosphatase 2C domain-containing protein n=1 Tax=Actinomadura parmotrematis TaxID=2864039 RepID=A0ABS7G2X4_9ACTN|nr:protein phosphatase 2C domain-containing protein [Actinomadura parmotrematis]MBW8485993.1 protein phosphatase 2C domain-containing protein [Actinomadura parmotrematis]